jgi:hypothetical protein
MVLAESIFFDFNLPNGTTWFYFSFLLAVALFLKFSRVLSIRNWDVVTLFLLVPGFLLLQQARPKPLHPEKNTDLALAHLVASSGGQIGTVPATSLTGVGLLVRADNPGLYAGRILWFGYLWLLVGSAYFLVRCLIDLILVSRPALAPNLSFGGLAWLGGALFICLIGVAYRPERAQQASTQVNAGVAPDKTVPQTTNNTPLPANQNHAGRESPGLELVQRPFAFWLTARTFAVLCHLTVVAGLIYIGAKHFQDAAAGMAAATFYLMLPYTGLYVGQVDHVWPAVLLVWALAAYRLPMVAGLLMGLASVTAYCTALTFPIWLSFYWKRGFGRFLAAFVVALGLGVAVIVFLYQSDELAGIVREVWSLSAWQPWKVPTTEGFWTGVHWAYRIPVFIAYLAFVITTAFWPAPKNLGHVISLSAAVLIGIQFWYADQGGVYVLWYLPLLALMVFRPNLSERRPAEIHPETDWLARCRRALGRLFGRLVKSPEPVQLKS